MSRPPTRIQKRLRLKKKTQRCVPALSSLVAILIFGFNSCDPFRMGNVILWVERGKLRNVFQGKRKNIYHIIIVILGVVCSSSDLLRRLSDNTVANISHPLVCSFVLENFSKNSKTTTIYGFQVTKTTVIHCAVNGKVCHR